MLRFLSLATSISSFGGNTKAFLDQLKDLLTVPGVYPGASWQGMLGTPQPRRHPSQIPEPPHLSVFVIGALLSPFELPETNLNSFMASQRSSHMHVFASAAVRATLLACCYLSATSDIPPGNQAQYNLFLSMMDPFTIWFRDYFNNRHPLLCGCNSVQLPRQWRYKIWSIQSQCLWYSL